MFKGDQEGINLLTKLSVSENFETQGYYRTIYTNLNENKYVYFTDVDEQRKKKLNNQRIFIAFVDPATNEWTVNLFFEPKR